jgi:hypothetical protein
MFNFEQFMGGIWTAMLYLIVTFGLGWLLIFMFNNFMNILF